jgi:hypothetical protein
VTANVPLIPQAIELIEKYKDHDCRTVLNKLFPVKSNQKMNAYLKEIGDHLTPVSAYFLLFFDLV